MELPELPGPAAEAVMDLHADDVGLVEAIQYLPEGTEFYTTEQVREIQRAAAQAAIEAAAKACEGRAEWIDCGCGCEMQKPKGPRDNAFVQAAAAIRAIQVG